MTEKLYRLLPEKSYQFLGSFTIDGQPYSLKNRQIIRVIKKGKRWIPVVTKSSEARKFMASMEEQVPDAYKDLRAGSLEEPLAVIVVIYYSSRRPDLDTHAIKDSLQNAGVVTNDRYIREVHAYGFLDKENPRAEVYLYKMLDHNKIPHPILEDNFGTF